MSNEKVDVISYNSLKKYYGYLLSEYNKFKYGIHEEMSHINIMFHSLMVIFVN